MKPVKICFVSLYAYHLFNPACKSQFGGAEIQLYYLATGLARDPNFNISFVVGDFGQPDIEIRDGVRIYKCFNLAGGQRYVRAIRLIKLLMGIDADIYVRRAASPITGMLALFGRFAHKKFVYMIAHDADVEKKPQYGKSWLWWAIFTAGLRCADLVVSQHQNQKEILKERYKKDSIVRRSAHLIPENIPVSDKEYILWVARCEGWKQPEVFIEIAKHFPGTKFVMICAESTNKMYFKKIRTEALKLPDMEFVEYVPFGEIDNYFLGARVFINTSAMEGFPNTLIQAAKNKALILSLSVNPDDILDKYTMGICAKGSFEKLKHDLEMVLRDKRLWQKLTDNAYGYAKENHDIMKIIEEDKKIFMNLVFG